MGRYVFIPFPDKGPMVRRVARPNARHDRKVEGAWFGALEIELLCDQPVHVGSGFKTEEAGKVVRRTARDGDRLLIPGSTLKGVLRSRFEAITRSCAGDPPNEHARIVSRSYPDVQRGRLAPGVRQLPVFENACGHKDQICPACALFGFQTGNATLRGRVSVADFVTAEGTAPVVETMPSQFEPRIHHLGEFRVNRNDREPHFEVGPLHGRKFYVGPTPTRDAVGYERIEAIPKGVSLTGTIRVFNLDDVELGGLLVALGVTPQSWIKLGSGKHHGFGRVGVREVGYALTDHRRRPRDSQADAWARAFEASVDCWEAGARRLVEIHREAC
jgi:CRISPR/Cas system CSM-associated protein Csm3 (group 7 of RAMP superfamily)